MSLQVGTFSDLTHLLWLDLSNNRIRAIADRQFAGLSLQHLFLNGNRHVDLRPASFDGLVTTGLYLHDCSLSTLPVDVLAPLNSSLRYLWLNGNELTSLSVAHRPLFGTLSHLRLGSNPLHCNCETSWLKDLFDLVPDVFRGAAAPSCLTPQRFRGRHFNDVSSNDFRCQAPAFSNIETAFGADVGGARLRCTATGDPAPTLYWIQPSGKTTRYGPPADEEARRNEGLLIVRETMSADSDPSASALFGMYICVANNEAGNVTLTINVSWPFITAPRPTVDVFPATTLQSVLRTSTAVLGASALFNAPTQPQRTHRPDRPNSVVMVSASTTESASRQRPDGDHTNYTVLHDVTGRGGQNEADGDALEAELVRRQQRLFTVTELVCAVIGTHVGTLAVCLVLLPLIYRRRRMMAARDKRDRAVVVAGLHPPPPAYGTTTTTNSTATNGPIPIGIGLRTGGSVGVEPDCKPLYRYPQNTLPSIPAESVYLNGTQYSTARRQQQQQFYQQQQQQPPPPQHQFLTEYLLTSQRR
jgi:hypothetical protein